MQPIVSQLYLSRAIEQNREKTPSAGLVPCAENERARSVLVLEEMALWDASKGKNSLRPTEMSASKYQRVWGGERTGDHLVTRTRTQRHMP